MEGLRQRRVDVVEPDVQDVDWRCPRYRHGALVRSPYVSAPNGDVSLQQMLDGFAGFRRLFSRRTRFFVSAESLTALRIIPTRCITTADIADCDRPGYSLPSRARDRLL